MDSGAPSHHHQTSSHHHQPPSSSDLLSSAKLLAETAKATLHHDSAKVDMGKVAGAAEDLLQAASHYGKLEEKSFGKYVEQAESYLHQYHSSHSSSSSATTAAHSAHHSSGGGGDHHTTSSGGGGGGYGDYLKMAEGFLKKH